MFELSFEIHFAINVSSIVRLLPHHRQKCFLKMFKNCEVFFAFCGVILGINNISFGNSMQWMNEIKIYIVSSPLNVGGEEGVLVFKIQAKRGVMKNCSEIGVSWKGRGFLVERGFPKCFISFTSVKHVFITIGIHFFCLVNIHACCNQ